MGECILHTVANTLNFRVVGGTTEPTNPRENTIWVNTETEITGWSFKAEEPKDPEEGMVWIKVGSSGAFEFNALKTNAIHVYPLSAKQYIDGKWVEVTSKTYKDGEMKEWFLYLFNKGDSASSVTGGWSVLTVDSNPNATTVPATITTSNNLLEITFTPDTGDAMGGACSTKKIDLTDYSKLIVEVTQPMDSNWKTDWENGLHLVSELADNFIPAATIALTSTGTKTLDVSSLTGEYYIVIEMGAGNEFAKTNSCTISEMYLN